MMSSPKKGLVALNGIFCIIDSKRLHKYELTKIHNDIGKKNGNHLIKQILVEFVPDDMLG